jgi:hypothetical protein
MPNTPAPETGDALAHRVEEHREELLVFMADTPRCDDITRGIDVIVNDLERDVGTLSDRRLKRDITPVDWSGEQPSKQRRPGERF